MSLKTNETVEALRNIYHLHRQLTDLKGRLRRGPERLTIYKSAVARVQKTLEDLEEEHKKARMTSDAKQGRLQDGEERVKKLQTQLRTCQDINSLFN